MIYLILDTNIWLYLANGYDSEKENHIENIYTEKHFELLKTINNKVLNKEYKILVNDVILKEWERNKNSTEELIHYLENKQKEIIKHSKSLKPFLSVENFKIQQTITKSAIENISQRIEANRIHIRGVEDLLKGRCQRIPISTKVKNFVSDLAIEKKEAPFQRDKNNFADAVILYSAVEYLRKELLVQERRAIFVSNNYKDFSGNNNKDEFHPDIKKQIENLDLTFQRHLTKAMDLSQEMQEEIEGYLYLRREIHEEDFFTCYNPSCNIEDNFQPYGYLNKNLRVVGSRENYIPPNQLKLFKLPKIDKSQIELVGSGNCHFCDIVHVECPECSTIMCDIDDLNFFYCRNCEESYSIKISKKENDKILVKEELIENFT